MKKITLLLFLVFVNSLLAQTPTQTTSSKIYHDLQKLNFFGSVLYLAAHPDDENTKLISHFVNKEHARTAYLSLTRGDGGQNLIGPEIREALGVIRTQELLAARAIDGGQQFFSRANDFGYSKTPQETLRIWNEDAVLSDVVWMIRKFQPDVIINRFDHRTEGTTHGHHTASAQLSVRAFELAGDPKAFPEQLEHVDVWQPKRLFFNTSWWFYGSQEKFEAADKSNMLRIDVGSYYPLLGTSNTEIAAASRSQHKSQGFGNTPKRGSDIEYIEYIKGKLPKPSQSVFEGIDTGWSRLKGAQKVGKLLTEVEQEFDFDDPSKSLPKLVKAYQLLADLTDSHWKTEKQAALKKIIAQCAGLYLEAATDEEFATPGSSISVNIEATNRSSFPVSLTNVSLANQQLGATPSSLKNNSPYYQKTDFSIPATASYSTPYWLTHQSSLGMYQVPDQTQRGKPENDAAIEATFELTFKDTPIRFTKPLTYKTNDAVKGEVKQPFYIVPKVSIASAQQSIIFNNTEAKSLQITLKAFEHNLSGTLAPSLPKNWKVTPSAVDVSLAKKGESQSFQFSITPPDTSDEAYLTAEFKTSSNTFSDAIQQIKYEHIPNQVIVNKAKVKLIKLAIEKRGERVAYIEGAGDVVPESLENIGYKVQRLQPDEITPTSLSNFDAVVIGIRAYNTVERLPYKNEALFEYAKNGGTVIVQYNTTRGLLTQELTPYPISLSRDRVTNEYAEVNFLHPEHPILNYPNKISKKDFEGWVQERGLYFPEQWDKAFTPILSMHDDGEKPMQGSLLVAPYGKGHYIYTGLSFFREFPAGVPGAFRLFANLISIGKNE